MNYAILHELVGSASIRNGHFPLISSGSTHTVCRGYEICNYGPSSGADGTAKVVRVKHWTSTFRCISIYSMSARPAPELLPLPFLPSHYPTLFHRKQIPSYQIVPLLSATKCHSSTTNLVSPAIRSLRFYICRTPSIPFPPTATTMGDLRNYHFGAKVSIILLRARFREGRRKRSPRPDEIRSKTGWYCQGQYFFVGGEPSRSFKNELHGKV